MYIFYLLIVIKLTIFACSTLTYFSPNNACSHWQPRANGTPKPFQKLMHKHLSKPKFPKYLRQWLAKSAVAIFPDVCWWSGANSYVAKFGSQCRQKCAGEFELLTLVGLSQAIGGSRPSGRLGPQSSRAWNKGGHSWKYFFSVLRVLVSPKYKLAPPLDLTLQAK